VSASADPKKDYAAPSTTPTVLNWSCHPAAGFNFSLFSFDFFQEPGLPVLLSYGPHSNLPIPAFFLCYRAGELFPGRLAAPQIPLNGKKEAFVVL